jgi:hypothetical protein
MTLKQQLRLGAAVFAASMAGALAFDLLTIWATHR